MNNGESGNGDWKYRMITPEMNSLDYLMIPVSENGFFF